MPHRLSISRSLHLLHAGCMLAALLLAAPFSHADEAAAPPPPSLSSLERQIDDFAATPQARFAPQTIAHARVLLAAATMAEQRQDIATRDQGARDTLDALNSARRVASDFSEKFATTLKLEQAATEAAGAIPDPNLAAAKENMGKLIGAFEQGQLNDSAVLAEDTNKQFLAIVQARLPSILGKTDAALVQASHNNAKRYAPTSYAQAQKWLADALAYNDGTSKKWPEHPRLGLTLATRAADLAEQIMQWHKKPDSFEVLVLKGREERRAEARALGLPLDDSDPLADIDAKRIVDAITQQKAAAQAQRQKYQQQLAALETQYQQRLEEKTTALRNDLTQQQGTQMNEMKEAFRAKLEQETFESRRQKKLGELFKKGEAEILASPDGSILLRLSSLQFASGATNIDKKYYDLLRRVRNGLDLYPDRKVSIEGHTDNRGDPKANQQLSLRRAETVRDFLVAAGMDAGRLRAFGYGDAHPIASNDYDRGRAMNRRIDIIIQAGIQAGK
jgi:outer membrane protein OmpA-like peptidoglycan-associated protein